MKNPEQTMKPVAEVKAILEAVGQKVYYNDNRSRFQMTPPKGCRDDALQNYMIGVGAKWHGRAQYWTYSPKSRLRELIAELVWDKSWKAKRIAKELDLGVDEVAKLMETNLYVLEMHACKETYFVENMRRITNYLRRLEEMDDPIAAVQKRTGLNHEDAGELLDSLESA